MPEWKAASFGKNTRFGKVTKQTIKEQRESLPIYSLRQQLLAAVRENQVLVVIGETGSG
jgi:ATP-dependent RNA helicase DHX8/PRP22